MVFVWARVLGPSYGLVGFWVVSRSLRTSGVCLNWLGFYARKLSGSARTWRVWVWVQSLGAGSGYGLWVQIMGSGYGFGLGSDYWFGLLVRILGEPSSPTPRLRDGNLLGSHDLSIPK